MKTMPVMLTLSLIATAAIAQNPPTSSTPAAKVTAPVFAQPFQASVTPDYAVFDRGMRIQGITLSIWGENPQDSLALGFVNGTAGKSTGLSFGLLLNYSRDYAGVQLAPINVATGIVTGGQFGLANLGQDAVSGVQGGLVNCARRLTGLQFGLVNYAETAEGGLQLGLVNFIPENQEWFTACPDEFAPGMLFLNWRF